MASLGAGYDLSSTYSPDGRLFQIEYAQKAVDSAGTIVAIRTRSGVVMAVERPIHSRLAKNGLNELGNRRIAAVEECIAVVGAGLIADTRALANRAREECSSHRKVFDESIGGAQLADRMARYVQAHTLYSAVRPFCAALVISALDVDHTPTLHLVQPSGVSWGHRACAVGKGEQLARTELEKISDEIEDLSLEQALMHAVRIVHLAHDEAKDRPFTMDVSWMGSETNYKHQMVPVSLLERAVEAAKEAVAARMDY